MVKSIHLCEGAKSDESAFMSEADQIIDELQAKEKHSRQVASRL